MHTFVFYNKFIIFLYMFRALCAHHQGVKIVLYSIWYRHTCRWPSRAQPVQGMRCTISKTSKFVSLMLRVRLRARLFYYFCHNLQLCSHTRGRTILNGNKYTYCCTINMAVCEYPKCVHQRFSSCLLEICHPFRVLCLL